MVTATPALPVLSSLARRLDTDPARFGFISPSNDLLDDPVALRERFAAEGYLYFKRFFDPALILEARASLMAQLAADGLLDPEHDPMEGVVHPDYVSAFALDDKPTFKSADGAKRDPDKKMAFRPDLGANNPHVHRVVFGPEIAAFYAHFFGEPVKHFDYIWLRCMGPGKGTPTHCDWVYMGRGSRRLMTCWIPYGDVPLEVGGLMMLERSHLQAARIAHYLSNDVDAYCTNDPRQVAKVAEGGGWSHRGWLSSFPDSLPAKFGTRWVTSERWEVGDFITFNMTLIHGSLDNRSDRVRISTDTRWQPASEPADERWIGVNPPGHSLAGKRGRIC